MTQNIKNFIEEGEKEFDKLVEMPHSLEEARNSLYGDDKYPESPYELDSDKVFNWHKQRQISLIKMIMEMVEEKKTSVEKLKNINGDGKDYELQIVSETWNEALDTILSKLKELK